MEEDPYFALQDYGIKDSEYGAIRGPYAKVGGAPEKHSEHTRVASLNMAKISRRSLSVDLLCIILRNIVRTFQLDILCLQELNHNNDDRRLAHFRAKLHDGGLLLTFQGAPGPYGANGRCWGGVAIITPTRWAGVQPEPRIIDEDKSGRMLSKFIYLPIAHSADMMAVSSIYGVSGCTTEFPSNAKGQLRNEKMMRQAALVMKMDEGITRRTDISIICTDANLLEFEDLDTSCTEGCRHEEGFLTQALNSLGYVDAIRSFYPDTRLYTFQDKNHKSYLDRILV